MAVSCDYKISRHIPTDLRSSGPRGSHADERCRGRANSRTVTRARFMHIKFRRRRSDVTRELIRQAETQRLVQRTQRISRDIYRYWLRTPCNRCSQTFDTQLTSTREVFSPKSAFLIKRNRLTLLFIDIFYTTSVQNSTLPECNCIMQPTNIYININLLFVKNWQHTHTYTHTHTENKLK